MATTSKFLDSYFWKCSCTSTFKGVRFLFVSSSLKSSFPWLEITISLRLMWCQLFSDSSGLYPFNVLCKFQSLLLYLVFSGMSIVFCPNLLISNSIFKGIEFDFLILLELCEIFVSVECAPFLAFSWLACVLQVRLVSIGRRALTTSSDDPD